MEKKKELGKSQMAKCDFCQNEFFARGLKAHIRLKHKLVPTQVTTQVVTQVRPVNLSHDLSRDLSQKSPKAKLSQSHSEPTQVLKSGGDLTQVPVTITKVTTQVTTYKSKFIEFCGGLKSQWKVWGEYGGEHNEYFPSEEQAIAFLNKRNKSRYKNTK